MKIIHTSTALSLKTEDVALMGIRHSRVFKRNPRRSLVIPVCVMQRRVCGRNQSDTSVCSARTFLFFFSTEGLWESSYAQNGYATEQAPSCRC